MIKDFTFIRYEKRTGWQRLFIYGFLFMELLPYVKTGYAGDDILNSLIKGACVNRSLPFFEILVSYILYGMKRGRCFFLAEILCYAIHYFISDRVVYKLLIAALTLLSVRVVEKLICYHFQTEDTAGLFLILCAAFFPIFYTGSNSLMMYHGFMQTEVILFFGSIYLLEKYLQEHRRKYLFWSVLIYSCSLFTYEISYVFILGIAVVCYSKGVHEDHKILKCYIISFCIGITITIVCRYLSANYFADGLYDGVEVSISNFGKVAKTFCIQFLGGVSFFHYFVDGANDGYLKEVSVAGIFSACLFLAVTSGYLRRRKKESLANGQGCDEKVFIILGCLLWFGSTGLIAVTEKYQRELLVSLHPHIPAYIEYFGMILLVFCACMHLLNTTKTYAKRKYYVYGFVILAGCMNHYLGMAHIKNYVKQTEAIYANMPDAYAQAIENGLLDQIDASDTIIIDISYAPVIYENLFAFYAKKPVKAERMDRFIADIDKNKIVNDRYEPQNTYITKYFESEDQTVVYLDKVKSIRFDEEQVNITGIKTSSISAWCKSRKEIEGLYTMQNGQAQIVSLRDCFCNKGREDYYIQTPEALYDYDSYTFWQ